MFMTEIFHVMVNVVRIEGGVLSIDAILHPRWLMLVSNYKITRLFGEIVSILAFGYFRGDKCSV